MFNKAIKIIKEAIPVLIMMGLIPFISNDYLVTLLFVLIAAISLSIKREKGDLFFMVVGFFLMMFFEAIFISTGVETFVRNSLFGLMPLWLPFLWAYAFIAVKRTVKILG